MAKHVQEVTFLSRLGHALSAAGDPVSSTERTLERVARSYGMTNVEIGVLPTLVLVRGHDGEAPTLDLAGAAVGADLRLDQVGALYEIVDLARDGHITADDGLGRLANVWSMPARFSPAIRIFGHVVLAVGLGLILTPRPAALVYCAVLGLIVALFIELGRRWTGLDALLPVVSSLAVSVLVFLSARFGQIEAPLLLLIPPLITFLPGGMLTTAMVELADRHPIAGASRLVAGATQVLLLVLGIVAGQIITGIPAELAFAQHSENTLGWWAPWTGPLVFAVGVYFHFVGPRRSLLWLCLIVYVAWVSEQAGNFLLGGYLGGFAGAATMTVAAFWLDRLPSAPPFQVLFLPAFWLLVPGVLAVVELAEFVGNEDAVALFDLGRVTFTILSVALGVLVGVALTRSSTRR